MERSWSGLLSELGEVIKKLGFELRLGLGKLELRLLMLLKAVEVLLLGLPCGKICLLLVGEEAVFKPLMAVWFEFLVVFNVAFNLAVAFC